MANVLNSTTQSLVRGIPQPVLGPVGNLILAPEGGFGLGPVKTNLVSYWNLNEGSGLTRFDSHGTNHLLQGIGNNVTQISGSPLAANVAHFDRTPQCTLELNAADTEEQLWCNGESFAACWWQRQQGTLGTIFVAGTWQDWTVTMQNTGKVARLTLPGDSNAVQSNIGTMSANAWYFVWVSYDKPTTTATISINDQATPNTAISVATAAAVNTRLFSLGDHVGTSLEYEGELSRMGFWREIPDRSVFTTLYNDGNGMDYADIP